MTETGDLVLAISILVALVAIFVISFVIYRRIPVPKGCEDLVMNEEKCSSCGHTECSFYKEKGDK